jgi:hypothetical protein
MLKARLEQLSGDRRRPGSVERIRRRIFFQNLVTRMATVGAQQYEAHALGSTLQPRATDWVDVWFLYVIVRYVRGVRMIR